jgi:hypothetical protein
MSTYNENLYLSILSVETFNFPELSFFCDPQNHKKILIIYEMFGKFHPQVILTLGLTTSL